MRKILDSLGTNITRISLNEMIGSGEWTDPGVAAIYLAVVERSGAESAAHACWGDSGGIYNCDNNSLDGLLTVDGAKPRSPWWVYKGYADITGRLVGFTLPADHSPANLYPTWVDGVVGQDSAKKVVRGIFGRSLAARVQGFVTDTGRIGVPFRFTNMNSVPYLGGTGKVHVTAQLIPKSGFSPLAAPLPALDAMYAVSDNALQFTVPNVGDGEAFTVLLTPEGGTAVAAHPLAGAAGGVSIDAGRRLHLPTRAAGVSVRLYSVSGRLLSGFRSQIEEGRAMDLGPRLQKAGGVAVAHVVCYDADGRGISDAALLIGQTK